jgi:hypothetical protein
MSVIVDNSGAVASQHKQACSTDRKGETRMSFQPLFEKDVQGGKRYLPYIQLYNASLEVTLRRGPCKLRTKT